MASWPVRYDSGEGALDALPQHRNHLQYEAPPTMMFVRRDLQLPHTTPHLVVEIGAAHVPFLFASRVSLRTKSELRIHHPPGVIGEAYRHHATVCVAVPPALATTNVAVVAHLSEGSHPLDQGSVVRNILRQPRGTNFAPQVRPILGPEKYNRNGRLTKRPSFASILCRPSVASGLHPCQKHQTPKGVAPD